MSAAIATAITASPASNGVPPRDLHFYVDMIGGRTFNDMDRSDFDWGVRGGRRRPALIPENVVLDPGSLAYTANLGGVVQSGTFANSQFFLEARPITKRAISSASIPAAAGRSTT